MQSRAVSPMFLEVDTEMPISVSHAHVGGRREVVEDKEDYTGCVDDDDLPEWARQASFVDDSISTYPTPMCSLQPTHSNLQAVCTHCCKLFSRPACSNNSRKSQTNHDSCRRYCHPQTLCVAYSTGVRRSSIVSNL